MPPSLRPIHALALLGLALTTCKEETPTLFEEEGTWSLVKYATDGGQFVAIDEFSREHKFLFRFQDEALGVATCVDQDGDNSPSSAYCSDGATYTWECRCFSYSFENSIMYWREYVHGAAKPSPPSGPGAMTSKVTVSKLSGFGSAYVFTGLPMDVFDSNGGTSKYLMQEVAGHLFDQSMCAEQCNL